MRSIADPPPRSALARFDPGFGQRFLVTVQLAEVFGPEVLQLRHGEGLDDLPRLTMFQQLCEDEGVVPLYLVGRPMGQLMRAAEMLRGRLASGKAEIGLQIPPGVGDPLADEATANASPSCNPPSGLEAAKLRELCDEFERTFQRRVAIDSSVRAKFDDRPHGGPDFRRHPLVPYWLDDDRRLLELPSTAVFWGMLRRQGDWLYPAIHRARWRRELLAQLGLLERIELSPQELSVDAAIRGIDIALDDGLPLLVFSVRGRSPRPRSTPAARSEDDLDGLSDWWRRVFAYLELRGVPPTTAADVMHAIRR